MLIKTRIKNEKITNIKIINKAFKKYAQEEQELMKKDYALIIYRSTKNKNSDSYADYINFFKKLSPEKRTIIFYGIPIELSKKQFAVLALLIKEQKLYNCDYAELNFLKKNNETKINTGSSLRSFASRFKAKCLNEIKSYAKRHSENLNTDALDRILNSLDDLIFCEVAHLGYALCTNFCLEQKMNIKERIKVQKK